MKKRNWTRREVITTLAQATAGLALSGMGMPTRAWSRLVSNIASADSGLFVHLVIEGGADMLQGLDPFLMPPKADDNDLWRGYRDADILEAAGIRLGPAARGLAPHIQDLALIRGIWMSTADEMTHEFCRAYCSSGMFTDRESSQSFVTEVSLRDTLSPTRAVVNAALEFRGVPAPTYSLISDLSHAPSQDLQDRGALGGLSSSFSVPSLALSRESFASSGPATQKLWQTIQTLAGASPPSEEIVMAAALACGHTRTAQLNLGGDYIGTIPSSVNLDTHQNHDTLHLAAQTGYWNRVAAIFNLFKSVQYMGTKDTLFDHTTFLVTNDFSRPPMLNSAGGKDHNCQTNSVLLAGRGVIGGQCVGGSELVRRSETQNGIPLLVGMPVDFKTRATLTRAQTAVLGSPHASVRLLVPENVILTLARGMGFSDYPWISRSDIDPIPGVMK